jgi:hypothetical protein
MYYYCNILYFSDFFFLAEKGPAALRLVVQPCDEDED